MAYKMEQKPPNDKYLTYDQMNIIIAFQKMWFKIAIWFRSYIRAAIYETPNLKSVTNSLIYLPSEVYSVFSIFSGTEAAHDIKSIFDDFIKVAIEVVEAMKYEDNVLTNSRIIEWYLTADELAAYLARINVNWDENHGRYLLYQYIKIKIDEINAVIIGNDEVEMELYKMVEDVNFLLASYMARGILISNSQPIPS